MAQALIIGGSTGMGRATAELLLAQGHEVAIVARNTANLSEVEAALGTQGTVRVYALDLANWEAVRAFGSTLPQLKYLVNAAGYFQPKAFLDHEEADYDSYHQFNKAFFFLTQAAAKVLKANGGGSIVNIGSM
jgi:NAD(P)-dependent dehydrogenase (short-subunit alcohol dehydrogenase family)